MSVGLSARQLRMTKRIFELQLGAEHWDPHREGALPQHDCSQQLVKKPLSYCSVRTTAWKATPPCILQRHIPVYSRPCYDAFSNGQSRRVCGPTNLPATPPLIVNSGPAKIALKLSRAAHSYYYYRPSHIPKKPFCVPKGLPASEKTSSLHSGEAFLHFQETLLHSSAAFPSGSKAFVMPSRPLT